MRYMKNCFARKNKDETKAFKEGWSAHSYAAEPEDCKYPAGSFEHKEWQAGYAQASWETIVREDD